MRIVPVPCLSDNYAYLVVDEATSHAAVVDPSESAPVLAAAEREGVKVRELWLTHHHFDHVGGNVELLEKLGDLVVRGSVYDEKEKRIPGQTVAHADGDTFTFESHQVSVIENPGHTLGAISFLVEGNLFSGDTLFLAGCGRVFEGTMAMMKDSLAKLRALPDDTAVWCGHEYTVKNLQYAATVEPQSNEVAAGLQAAKELIESGKPTIPGTIGAEKKTNPFFRFDVPKVAGGRDDVTTFTALREGKDRF
jgi:hydroxyacylglutathione hydrolase